MRLTPRETSLGALLMLIAVLTACSDGGSPARPSPPPPPPPPVSPGGPTQPSPVSLRVDGPSQVAPGGRAQYTATATLPDGSSRDVTAEATWTTTNESVLSLTGPGAITASAAGEGVVQAGLGTAPPGSHNVIVVPAGRFKLTVRVTEDQVTAPIADARVEVVSEPGGLVATTDWNGAVVLYGVLPDVELRVTKDGYLAAMHSVHLERHGSTHLQMFPSVSRRDLAGQYRLTISSGSCSAGSGLPEAATTRTYTARLWNSGLRINVALSDADFVPEWCPACNETRGNGFFGQTQALDARFTLLEYVPPDEGAQIWDIGQGHYPNVAERLPDGTLLSISGRAIVTPTADGFAGMLDGSIAIYDSLRQLENPGRVLASCRSEAHRFALVR